MAAVVAIVVALTRLLAADDGLAVRRVQLGTLPLTVFSPAAATGPAGPAPPVVVIAHGFAGSQQLMQPFALTLARNGYIAVTFDFPGHGRNAAPMFGGLVDPPESQRVLLAALETVGAYAAGLGDRSGHYAVLGHSMASDIVVRHAQAHPAVPATVAVSLFAPSITANTPADSPRNLLVITGALEPAMMSREALRVAAQGGGPGPGQAAVPGRTYGRFADGTARRVEFSPGAEHIGVLYSPHTQAQALAWLDQAFGRPPAAAPFIDAPGRMLGLLLAGIVVLAWPLARTLPRLAPPARLRMGVGRSRWGRVWPLVLAPAVATPLLLWKLPMDFMPLLLGDYLALHFGVYGLLTAALLVRGGWRLPRARAGRDLALVGAALAATAFAVLAIGIPVDRFVFNVQPTEVRWPLIGMMCAGTLPYFLADEWFARDPQAPPAAYFVSKLCFLLSLVAAIALNPPRLFFLALIVPAILLLFIVYGLFSRWIHRATGSALVAAIANGVAFGSFIAVTFPLVR